MYYRAQYSPPAYVPVVTRDGHCPADSPALCGHSHFDDVDLLYFVRQLIAASTKVLEYDKLTGKEQSVEMNTLANSLEKLRKKYMEFSP